MGAPVASRGAEFVMTDYSSNFITPGRLLLHNKAVETYSPQLKNGAIDMNHSNPAMYSISAKDPKTLCDKGGSLGSSTQFPEDCVPWFVNVWGVEKTKKLFRVKKKLDPKMLFQCKFCIGWGDDEQVFEKFVAGQSQIVPAAGPQQPAGGASATTTAAPTEEGGGLGVGYGMETGG